MYSGFVEVKKSCNVVGKFFYVPLEKDHKIADGTIFYCCAACFCESHISELYFVCTVDFFQRQKFLSLCLYEIAQLSTG